MGVKSSSQISIVDITDAYSVILTSESYTFTGDKEGAPVGLSCSTEVVAYCGTTPCPKVNVTQSKIVCPPGITATVANNNTLSPKITFETTAVIKESCEATIPVVVDGVTINKKFSFSVAKQGADGSSDIQIGGRNLLLDTRSMGVKAWYTGRYGSISDRISKNGVVTVPAGSTNFSMQLIDCKPNEEYVFSVDVKSKTTPFENAWCAILAYYNIAEDGKLTRIDFDKVIGDLTTEWQRFSKHIKVPNDPKIHAISIGFRAYFDSESNTPPALPEDIEVKLPKMERGNTPTDWSPAPEDVDNITTGGRNLLRNTKTMDKWKIDSVNSQYINLKDGVATFSATGLTSNSNAAIRQWIADGYKSTIENDTIVISFDIMSEDWDSIIESNSYKGLNGLNMTVYQTEHSPFSSSSITIGSSKQAFLRLGSFIANEDKPVNGKWFRYTSIPITINDELWSVGTDDEKYVAFLFSLRRNGTVHVKNFKIERGTVATDWSPAPEDIEADVNELRTEYKAELKIEQDRITANVEATDALGSRVSKVEQTADGLEVSLSNLKFGGRNLLLKTGELLGSNFWADTSGSEAIGKVASQSDGSILITNTNTNTRIVTNPIDVSLNTDYMISIDYKLVSGSHPFQIQTTEYEEDGKTVVMHGAITSDKYTSTPIGGGWYRIVAPYRTSNNQKTKKFRPWFRTGLDYENYTCQYYIRRPKMEIGNVATDWTPAPEDVLDAPKTATNFLSYDSSNGLQIGNKSSGSWTGTRARIKPSAFEIIDSAGAVLASYAANRIDLGKNSKSSVIGLCGNAGKISVATFNGYESLSIDSNSIALAAKDSVYLSAYDPSGGNNSMSLIKNRGKLSVTDQGSYIGYIDYSPTNIELRSYNPRGSGASLLLDGANGDVYLTSTRQVIVSDNKALWVHGYRPMLGELVGSYWGLRAPNSDRGTWIRTTMNGIIPYQQGGSSALGTSSWPFTNIYANNIFDNGTLLEDKFVVNRGFYTNVNNFDNLYTPGVWGINGLNIRLTMYNSLLDGSSVTYTWNVWGNLYVAPHFSYQMLMCNDPRNGRPNILIRHKLGNPAAWSYWVSLGN